MIHNNSGIISLVVTVIIGLLFNVIAMGAIAVNTAELRQAADFDQSTKAYYAAEISVEDFIATVQTYVEANNGVAPRSTNNNCNTTYSGAGLPIAPPNSTNITYICQDVTIDNNGTPGNLSDDEYIIDAAGKAGDVIRRVKVRLPIPN